MQQAAAPLQQAVARLLGSSPEDTFIASVAPVPAGSAAVAQRSLLASAARPRRALRQDAAKAGPALPEAAAAAPGPLQPGGVPGEWLEVVMVAGGSDPLRMYGAAQASLT